ncbi:MAG: VWA domain-containing protein [candidate division Zixibacteria bacterium]|nr:VWA domain-containing protein [candidate division Zixibacteria bacterium]
MLSFLPGIRSLGVDFPSADRWVVLILALLFIGALFWYYAQTLPPLEKKQRRLLLGLRLLGFICLFLVLAEPIVALFLVSKEAPVVAVLADRSTSMSKQSRARQAGEAIEKLASQKGDWEYRIWDFGDSLADYRALSPEKATATAMGSALQYVSETPHLVGVVVISDGGNNSGKDPVRGAEKLGVPVYTVAVGEEERTLDLGIEKIDYPPVAFQGTPVKIELVVSARGAGKMKLPLTVSRGSRRMVSPLVDFSGDGERVVMAELTPDSVGTLTFSASLPVLAKEEQTKNNRRVFSMRVLKSKLSLLLVSGTPGWNYRFLAQVLEENHRLEVEGVVYGPGGRPLFSAAPLSNRNLERYDLLIFTDFSPALFAGVEARLASAVRDKGKGVFFLLGPDFLASPLPPQLAELFPFDFKKRRATLTGPIGELDLTAEGGGHPATRLLSDPGELGRIWKNLPPLEGVVASATPSTEGTILASVPATEEGRHYPALAAKNFGAGRVLAAAVFPVWKWYFLPLGTSSEDTTFAWFVNQSAGWLAGAEEEDRFNLSTDKLVYRSGEEVSFSAAAFEEGGKPYEGLDVTLQLGGELLLYEQGGGRYAGRKRMAAPGSYQAVANFFQDKKKVGEAKSKFMVEELSLEDQTVSFNPTLLEKMAAASGGTFYRPEEVERFARDFNPQKEERPEKREWELAHQPVFLVGMILFLGAEWYLRRRWQLL